MSSSSPTTTTPPSSTTAVSSTSTSTSPRAQEEARAAILASLASAGSKQDTHFQRRAADIHANARALATQEAAVRKQTAALAKESAQWGRELARATKAVNEVGDVQNWAEMLERDMLVLEETLRLVEGEERPESASGGSEWRGL